MQEHAENLILSRHWYTTWWLFTTLQTEIISFSERNNEFTAINAQVLAISTDSHHTHLAWTRSKREDGGVGRLNIPLVADTSKQISANYGVLVTDESDDMFGAGKNIKYVDTKSYMENVK